MKVSFADPDLDELERNPSAKCALDYTVVRAFRKVMNLLRTAVDLRDLYAWKSLHFEKLKGNRACQHSLRLNEKWRLIVEVQETNPGHVLHVVSIEDYH